MSNKQFASPSSFNRLFSVAAWVYSLGFFAYFLGRPVGDLDFFWHLAAGREMVEKRIFLNSEIFSHTMYGQPWINFEWLSQICLYLTYKLWGISGIFFFKVFLGLLAIFILVLACRKAGARGVWLLLFAWWGFSLLQRRIIERPELFSFILFGLFVYLILAGRSWSPQRLRWLPLIVGGLMVLWCNLHAASVYGIVLIVLLNMGARWNNQKTDYINALDRCLVAVLLAFLINPHGPYLVNVFLEHLDQSRGQRHVLEWQPTATGIYNFWLLGWLVTAFIGVFLFRKENWPKFWAPVLLFFFVFGTQAIRNVVYLPFVALPFLSESVGHMGGMIDRHQRVFREGVALAVLCISLYLYSLLNTQWSAPGKISEQADNKKGAVQFIKNNDIQGNLYNRYGDGGYLAWALGPQRKIFMDGRYLFYHFLQEESKLSGRPIRYAREKWQRYFDRYNVTYALVSLARYSDDTLYPRELWALVYWDDDFVVLLKRLPANQPLIHKFEYQTITPQNLEMIKTTLREDPAARQKTEKELLRHEAEVGPTKVGIEIKTVLPNSNNHL